MDDDKSKQSGARSAEKRRARTAQAKDAGQPDLPATGDVHGELVDRMTASHADAERSRHEHTMTAQERYEAIARIAYFRAQQRSFEPGREVDDWLAAEREFEQTLQSQVTQAAAPRNAKPGNVKGPTAKRAAEPQAAKPQTDAEAAPQPAAKRRNSEAGGSGVGGAGSAHTASADAATAGQAPPKPAARKRKSG